MLFHPYERHFGSVRDLLPQTVYAEVERTAHEVAPRVAERLAAFVESPEFDRRAREFIARARAELADRPIGSVLTPERRCEIRARATAWGEELARSPELERGVR